jgi:hypothetical protein
MEVSVITALRMRRAAGVALCLFVAPFVALLPTPAIAGADDPVPIGGGAGIIIDTDTYCTLTAIGNDKTGALIGFTSAHCGGPGAQVSAEGAADQGVIGPMVAGNDGLDYAVIRFDPAKVTPVSNWNGFKINGIGPDPKFGEIGCKLGRTTGYSCGVTWGPGEEPGTIVNQVCGQPGDSGDGQQQAGGHDPRGVHRRTAHLCHQVHPTAHPGGDHVDQCDPGRPGGQGPAGCRIRADRQLGARSRPLLALS